MCVLSDKQRRWVSSNAGVVTVHSFHETDTSVRIFWTPRVALPEMHQWQGQQFMIVRCTMNTGVHGNHRRHVLVENRVSISVFRRNSCVQQPTGSE
jgi:hypothetical protein